jgi:hypothetical protein
MAIPSFRAATFLFFIIIHARRGIDKRKPCRFPNGKRQGVCLDKSLAEFAAAHGGEENSIIFRRGVYVAKNTAQTASVRA